MPELPDALGIDQTGWPEVQYVSACFAGAIHDYYLNEKKEAPQIINQWKEMCKTSVLPEAWHLAWYKECCADKKTTYKLLLIWKLWEGGASLKWI